jgi:hypothetical protein
MSNLQLRDVHFRQLVGLSHELAAGPHWISCNDAAAATDLIELCGGLAHPRRGQVLLDETPVAVRPASDFAILPPTVAFPHLRVDRMMNLALRLKGSTQSAEQLLAAWDLSDLAGRVAGALDTLSSRRIALLLALATPNPKLLALHDVLGLGLSRERLQQRLLAASAAGAVVLLTADRSELTDAHLPPGGLADASVWVLQPGRLVRPERLPDPHPDGSLCTLYVVCSNARALSEELSRDTRISSLRLDERMHPSRIEVMGSSSNALAKAVADAALQRDIDIRQLAPSLSPILELARAQPRLPNDGGATS